MNRARSIGHQHERSFTVGWLLGIGYCRGRPNWALNVIKPSCAEFGETAPAAALGVRNPRRVTDEHCESLGMDDAKGALVAGVIRGGPVDDGFHRGGRRDHPV